MPAVPSNYVSCIKVRGVPILPPLITDDYRKELLKYKEQALMIEKGLEQRKRGLFTVSKTVVKDISNVSTHQKIKDIEKTQPTVDGSSQTLQLCVPSTVHKKKRNVSLTSCVLDVAEFSDSGCRLVNHNGVSYSDEPHYYETDQEESTRYDAKSSIMSEDGEFFIDTPRLKRSASYILENPSPVLLAHLEKQSLYSPLDDLSLSMSNMSRSFTEGFPVLHKSDNSSQSLIKNSQEYQYEVQTPKHFEEGSGDAKNTPCNLDLETNNFLRQSSPVVKSGKLYEYDIVEVKPAESFTRENYFANYPLDNVSHAPSNASSYKQNTEECLMKFENKPFTGKAVDNEVPYKLTIDEDSIIMMPSVAQEVDMLNNQNMDADAGLIAFDRSTAVCQLIQDMEQPQSIPLSEDSITTTIIRTETVEYIDKIISSRPHTGVESPSPLSPVLKQLVPTNSRTTEMFNQNSPIDCKECSISDHPSPVEKNVPATKVVVEKITSIRISRGPVDDPGERKQWAASVIGAAVRGYLTRRLMKTDKVQSLIQTIQDAVLCAVQLHEVTQLEEADVELHRRLIQQVSAACYAFHDVFFALTKGEQMSIIAADRKRKIEKAKKCLLNTIQGH